MGAIVLMDIACICPEHPDSKGCIPGKIIVMDVERITKIKRYSIVLHRHPVIMDVSCTALVHHYNGLRKLDRNLLTLKFLSYEKIKKNI